MEEWLEALEAEVRMVNSRSLNVVELRNHISVLLESLSSQLQVAVNLNSESDALRDAETHGDTRWTQKFQLHELFREIAMLRTIVIERVEHFTSAHSEFSAEARCLGHKIVHRFFDALIADSVSRFSKRKEDAAAKAEQELRTLNDALEKRNGEYAVVDAARKRMIRTLSHELRTPLNAVGLAVHLLDSGPESVRKQSVETIKRTIAAYRSLLNQVLEFARMEELDTVHVASFSLKPFFDELVLLSAMEAKEKNLSFTAQLDPGLQQAVSDKARVLLIVRNLLTNAFRYSDSGSVNFTIRAANEHFWEIEVTDTGQGISETEINEIFTPWYRISPHGTVGGTGLGLSIVKSAVETLGGNINVESELGKGSRFVVTLPRTSKRAGLGELTA